MFTNIKLTPRVPYRGAGGGGMVKNEKDRDREKENWPEGEKGRERRKMRRYSILGKKRKKARKYRDGDYA
jgi:hypothetical protein